GRMVALGSAAQKPQHAGGGIGVEDGPAGGDVLQCLHEPGGIDFLHQVTVRAGGDRVINEVVVRVRRQDHHARVGQLRENLPAGLETAPVGQPDVEENDIRLQLDARVHAFGDG